MRAAPGGRGHGDAALQVVVDHAVVVVPEHVPREEEFHFIAWKRQKAIIWAINETACVQKPRKKVIKRSPFSSERLISFACITHSSLA